MSERYCLEVAGMGIHSATPSQASPPKDAKAATAWLLLELWDARLVDVWIWENARYYVQVADPSAEESIIELEIYLRKLEGDA
jgi:hypothetical protein